MEELRVVRFCRLLFPQRKTQALITAIARRTDDAGYFLGQAKKVRNLTDSVFHRFTDSP